MVPRYAMLSLVAAELLLLWYANVGEAEKLREPGEPAEKLPVREAATLRVGTAAGAVLLGRDRV